MCSPCSCSYQSVHGIPLAHPEWTAGVSWETDASGEKIYYWPFVVTQNGAVQSNDTKIYKQPARHVLNPTQSAWVVKPQKRCINPQNEINRIQSAHLRNRRNPTPAAIVPHATTAKARVLELDDENNILPHMVVVEGFFRWVETVRRVGSNDFIPRDRWTVMYVGTLRFDGEIIPSISSNARWLFGVSVRRGRSKRNIDRKLFQSHTCLLAISAVSLVILSAQYPCTRESMVYI